MGAGEVTGAGRPTPLRILALTREVSRGVDRCELTHLTRQPIDLARAREQHRAYERALEALGCTILRLPEAPDLPDAVFVEDTAVVLDELAVIARPGAASRREETESVAAALARHLPLARIEPPGTLDGGDVLRVGRRIWAGVSSRTNPEGIEQLRRLAAPLGYGVVEVPVRGCLHLKSAATPVAAETLLINPAWVDRAAFPGFDFVEVDPEEPAAANALLLEGTAIYPAAYPRTRARLEACGIDVRTVDVSELAKAEGGVTCCMLAIPSRRRAGATDGLPPP